MTKTQHILSLYDGKRSTSEIAEIVGCHPAYVRVVARQRRGRSHSEVEERYLKKRYGTKTLTAAWRERTRDMRARAKREARAS